VSETKLDIPATVKFFEAFMGNLEKHALLLRQRMEEARQLADQLRQARFATALARAQGIHPDKVTNYALPLSNWLSSLPPAAKHNPWSLETIMAAAYPGKRPAPRCVATALRQLGFTQKRDWSGAGLNRRFWIAPLP